MAEIPLFPLPMVLFPGGKLPLQIFEPRYLDMVKNCMREEIGFGVILIEEGQQVLKMQNNSCHRLPTVGPIAALLILISKEMVCCRLR